MADAKAKGVLPHGLAGHYLALMEEFYVAAGVPPEDIRFRVLSEEDRAFYSKAAYDLEIKEALGWVEHVACNYRGDYDLGGHARVSGSNFTVDDDGEKVLPHVFELSMGIDRSVFTVMDLSLKGEGERRVLSLKPYLAPVQAAVFPLVNKDGLQEKAREIVQSLKEGFDVFYDESGAIGRRYARADEAGVPACLTVDYDTLKDGTVTLRDRDTRSQERVRIEDLEARLGSLLKYPTITG